jgi:tRNA uridine 5-carboxymethylaminomethyl modification enzyme
VVSDTRWMAFQAVTKGISQAMMTMKDFALSPQGWAQHGFDVRRDGVIRRFAVFSSL